MNMIKKRNIISATLSIILSLSFLIFLCSLVVSFTVSSRDYFEKNLVTGEVISQCQEQLDEKYTMLEKECGIPLRVFKMVEKDYAVNTALQNAAHNIFTAENSALYTNDLVDYFYDLCVEYLSGNDIKFKDENIRNTAEKAAKIYSETVGIHNTDDIKDKLSYMSKKSAVYAIITFLLIVACFASILIMYKRKHLGYIYAFSGIASGGFAATLGSLLVYATNPFSELGILPQVYNLSVMNMTRHSFFLLAGLSAICTLASYVAIISIYRAGQSED